MTPKLTMKETTSVVEVMPNSSDPISGDCSFHSNHAADEGVHQHEESKLPPVLPQPKPDTRVF